MRYLHDMGDHHRNVRGNNYSAGHNDRDAVRYRHRDTVCHDHPANYHHLHVHDLGTDSHNDDSDRNDPRANDDCLLEHYCLHRIQHVYVYDCLVVHHKHLADDY